MKNIFITYNVEHKDCKIAAAFASMKDYQNALNVINAHLAHHPDDNLCRLQKLMIELEMTLGWCYAADSTHRQKLEQIKDDHREGCVAANAILREIWNFDLPDERIIQPSTHRPEYFEEEKTITIPDLKIYPNPAEDFALLELSLPGEHEVFITDINGKIMSTGIFNNHFYYVETNGFPNGIYFVNVRTEKENISARFIVIK